MVVVTWCDRTDWNLRVLGKKVPSMPTKNPSTGESIPIGDDH